MLILLSTFPNVHTIKAQENEFTVADVSSGLKNIIAVFDDEASAKSFYADNKKSYDNLVLYHLDDVIDYCLGSDDVPATKPNPVSVGMAMEHFNIKNKNRVIYIGDNTIDYTFASNAGIDCALLTWGPRKFDPSTNPKYWVKDFDELYKVIVG